MILTRRGLLAGLGASLAGAVVAPSIVRAAGLMPIRSLEERVRGIVQLLDRDGIVLGHRQLTKSALLAMSYSGPSPDIDITRTGVASAIRIVDIYKDIANYISLSHPPSCVLSGESARVSVIKLWESHFSAIAHHFRAAETRQLLDYPTQRLLDYPAPPNYPAPTKPIPFFGET